MGSIFNEESYGFAVSHLCETAKPKFWMTMEPIQKLMGLNSLMILNRVQNEIRTRFMSLGDIRLS